MAGWMAKFWGQSNLAIETYPVYRPRELCSGRVLAAKSNGQKVSQAKNCQCQWPVKCHVQFRPPVTESSPLQMCFGDMQSQRIRWRQRFSIYISIAFFAGSLFLLCALFWGKVCNGFWILCAANGQLHLMLKELSDLPHAI